MSAAGAPTIFRIILPVSDIEAAARFYEAALGLRAIAVSPGRRYFECGGVILACFDPRADGDGYDAHALPEWIYLAVDDLESAQRAWTDAGGTLSAESIHGDGAGEIRVRPWGERSFYGIDPFGNKLCFVDRSTVFTGR